MKYNKIIKILMIPIIIILLIPQTVYADMGPKPSITIYVKNYKNRTYYLDLLTKNNNIRYTDFNDHGKYSNDIKNMPFYKYNEGGWMATHIRKQLLYGHLKGEYNEKTGFIIHRYYYHAIPKTFKIIVQEENGDLLVSNVITPMQFNAKVLLDLQTGKVTKIPQISYGFYYFLILIVLTVIIELLIAILFKFKSYKLIIKANILTQLILHFILVYTFDIMNYKTWYTEFLILEVLVILIEFLIYRIFSKNYSWKKLLIYTCTANIVTFILGLLI